jgi:protein involved in polysaccharide export with SLBB domain
MDLAQTPAAQIRLSPGDVVRVNPVFTERESGPVALTGEFVRPGVYSITRGERLSGLIARAGGVTEQAYPYGAVFTRERVKEEERRNFDRYLRELQSAMAVAASKARTEAGGTAAVEAVKNLVDELRRTPPLGRVVVEADPTVLQVRPEEDLILEPGDRLHMPKRPNYVTITGEVLNPGTVAFRSDTSSDKYIDMAGGLSRASDEGRTFVVLPNGTAQPLSVSAWNYEARMIPPGSTIVVPRDPLPFDWLTLSRDLTGIISNLAVTAAALSTINN